MRLRRSWLPGLLGLVLLLLAAVVASLALGSNPLPPSDVWAVVAGRGTHSAEVIVAEQRLPRTVLVILVGISLGVSGALMQAITRNPLADPGILGISAGSALAVVAGVVIAGQLSIGGYVWWALAGAVIASLAVYALGTGGSPAQLTLAGVAVSMAVTALSQAVLLSNAHVYNEFRFWAAGSVEGRGFEVIGTVAGFILVGVVLALAVTPALNAMALGDEHGVALGVRTGAVRTTCLAAITLLCGAATAAVGPIMFVGLAVPYLARTVVGTDLRGVLPACMLIAPIFLLLTDVAARLLIAPKEIQTGIVAALIGGPIFLIIVTRQNVEAAA